MIRPWPSKASERIGDYRIFTIRSDKKVSPRTGAEHGFYVIEAVDWVNVIAVTPNEELVMIEQYRHGTDTVELEIPGGMVDKSDESPAHAGFRELREETGYEGDPQGLIGQIFPNPAIMNNTCFTALAVDCQLRHPTAFDHGEDILTRLVPVSDLQRLVADGKIRHSLVVVALYHFELWRRNKKASAR